MVTRLKSIIKKQPQLIILIVMFILFFFLIPSFGTDRNLLNVMKTAAISAFTCIGLSVVLIGGNLDLSVGSTMSLLCVLSITAQKYDPFLGVFVPVAAAIGIGLLNGIFVYRFRISSIVVTLGTMSILSGLALMPSDSMSVQGLAGTWYSNIAGTMVGPIPVYIIYFLLLVVGIQFLITKTLFGKSLFFLGNNKEASEIAGHNVGKTVILSFIICSLCVCVSAIVLSSRTMTANPIGGMGLEFEALTAVLLGGISLLGGKGSIMGTVIGVLLLSIIVNGMNLLGAAYEYQMMARGILILVAIIVDAIVRYKDVK